MRPIRHLFLLILVLLTVSCAAPTPEPRTTPELATADPSTGLTLPSGFHIEVLAMGLNQPTHVAVGPDGAFYLTQLNGGENDGKGQVVRIVKPGAEPEVLLNGMFKPTGLAWAGDTLYVVSGNNVLVSHLKDGKTEPPTILFGDLPFNGRSNGQIAVGPDGLLYFQGTGREGQFLESGYLYVANSDGTDRKIYARGLKNAYATAWNAQTGQLYATDIADGAISGVGQPPDELNLIHRGGNYGWPYCYADQKENHDVGGNRNICADTDSPIAIFPPDSTPTGLAWFDGALIVALWNGNPPRLVRVDPKSGSVSDYAAGFKRPIALLALPDNSLLVVDMEAGTLYRLAK